MATWSYVTGMLPPQYDQAASVRACFDEAGFTDVRLDRDADELDRVISGRHAGG